MHLIRCGVVGRLDPTREGDLTRLEESVDCMRTILYYGDSNTWGSAPETGERYPAHVRWPGVMGRVLGEGYRVIKEGLSGGATLWDDPIEGAHKNGRTYLTPCLESHRPLDLVVLMLGTNDLKTRFSASASDIAQSAARLAGGIQHSGCGPQGGAPKVPLISPPSVGHLTEMAEMFERSEEKSRRFEEHYRRFAGQYGCEFLAASEVVFSSDVDGIHLKASEHDKLGEAVANRVGALLG